MPDAEFTNPSNPNLERMLASQDMLESHNKYSVFIAGTNSYRSVEYKTDHDEQSDNNEIP